MRRSAIVVLAVVIFCAGARGQSRGSKPVDAMDLTQDAVQVAMTKYFSDEKHSGTLIFRSIFTPGKVYRIVGKEIPVTSRAEIAKGKEVSLVRIAEVMIRDTDSAPPQRTVVVKLVTWSEVGQEITHPMHAFPTYEMALDENDELKIVKETLVVE